LLEASGAWALAGVTGAAFDSWTNHLASVNGCATKLTKTAGTVIGTA